jgi:hypothetical protein
MKILLIGAPGSGKSKFGRKKAKEHSVKFLDKLPEKYIKKTGLALGQISDYRVDVMFACNCIELENSMGDNGFVITAGPIYTYFHFVNKVRLLESEKQDATIYMFPGLFMGDVVRDSLWYDEIYYLPYKGKDEYSIFFDDSIRRAIKDLRIKDRVIEVD